MKKSFVILAALAALSFSVATPVRAQDQTEKPKHAKQDKFKHEFTMVRGEITKIDGSNLIVDGKTVTRNDKTKVFKGREPYTEDLKVGDRISARINKDGIAVRIEVAGPKHAKNEAPKTDAPAGDAK